jgi:hypothetical protein
MINELLLAVIILPLCRCGSGWLSVRHASSWILCVRGSIRGYRRMGILAHPLTMAALLDLLTLHMIFVFVVRNWALCTPCCWPHTERFFSNENLLVNCILGIVFLSPFTSPGHCLCQPLIHVFVAFISVSPQMLSSFFNNQIQSDISRSLFFALCLFVPPRTP